MTTISHPNTLAARTVLVDRDVSGLREIDSFGSIVQVRAAPFSDLDRLVSTACRLTFVTYVIDATKVYIGRGKGDRKIGDRFEPEEIAQAQVYILHSLDARYDQIVGSYLEARLIDIGHELGVPLANRIRPLGRGGARISPDLEQVVVHAQELLEVAGFRRFWKARQDNTGRPARLAATADLNDVRLIEPEEMVIPVGTVIKRLDHKVLKAEGFELGDRFVVLPGADYCYETKSGLSVDNRERRAALEELGDELDLLQELPGVTGRARLRVGLDCTSAPIAAKIISGEHVDNDAWQEAPSPGSSDARPA
jgi:predicted nucleotidyltransferase